MSTERRSVIFTGAKRGSDGMRWLFRQVTRPFVTTTHRSDQGGGTLAGQRDTLAAAIETTFLATTFTDPDLLRATPLSTVMRCGANLYQSRAGDERTFALSSPVGQDAIDVFISHNWDVPRHSKFLALLFTFNRKIAFASFLFVCSVSAILVWLGWLRAYVDQMGYRRSMWATAIGVPVFFMVLVFYRDVLFLLGLRGPMVFLDKVCIHQTDKQKQQAGIQLLAGFLANSKCLLVLYTDLYLEKVWTVYELATMLTLHPDARLRMVPLFVPRIVFSSAAVLWIAQTIFDYFYPRLLRIEDRLPSTESLVVMFGLELWYSIVFFMLGRLCENNDRAMQRTADNFDIRTAKCFVEDDRKLVVSNVQAFMRSNNRVSAHADEDEAINAFNAMVREDVPPAIKRRSGETALKYQYILVILLVDISKIYDNLAVYLLEEPENKTAAFLEGMATFTITLLVHPIVAWAMQWAGGRTSRHFVQAILVCLMGPLLHFALTLPPLLIMIQTYRHAGLSISMAVVANLLLAIYLSVTMYLYGGCPKRLQKLRKCLSRRRRKFFGQVLTGRARAQSIYWGTDFHGTTRAALSNSSSDGSSEGMASSLNTLSAMTVKSAPRPSPPGPVAVAYGTPAIEDVRLRGFRKAGSIESIVEESTSLKDKQGFGDEVGLRASADRVDCNKDCEPATPTTNLCADGEVGTFLLQSPRTSEKSWASVASSGGYHQEVGTESLSPPPHPSRRLVIAAADVEPRPVAVRLFFDRVPTDRAWTGALSSRRLETEF